MVRKIKNMIALLVALGVLACEIWGFISQIKDVHNRYLYNRVSIRSDALIEFILASLVILTLIFLIYLIIKKFKLLIFLVIPCLIALFFVNILTLLFFFPVDSDSYTDDPENYLILDENAMLPLSEELFDFDNPIIKEYEYRYKAFPMTHSITKIDTTVELSEQDYEKYLNMIKIKFYTELDNSYVDSEGGVRYTVDFDKRQYPYIIEHEYTITFYGATNEVKISFFVDYDS